MDQPSRSQRAARIRAYLQSDFSWLVSELLEALSWTGVGWFVALLVGVWGAMIGVGAFRPAFVFLGLTICLCALKWGHVTKIVTPKRRLAAFIIGLIVLAGFSFWMIGWTLDRKSDDERQSKRMEQLNQLPGMTDKISRLPVLEAEVKELEKQNREAADKAAKKQDTIEGLTNVVIEQNKTISKGTFKKLEDTQSAITGVVTSSQTNVNANINRYRTDTSTAVSKILRPARTLGDKRPEILATLKNAAKIGIHHFSVSFAHGEECMDFANELKALFRDAGWVEVRSQSGIILEDGQHLRLLLPAGSSDKDVSLTADEKAVATAFYAIGMQLEANPTDRFDSSKATEIYVGLQ